MTDTDRVADALSTYGEIVTRFSRLRIDSARAVSPGVVEIAVTVPDQPALRVKWIQHLTTSADTAIPITTALMSEARETGRFPDSGHWSYDSSTNRWTPVDADPFGS
ncbi:hypothetical protein [Enemella evansiae]|uniref:hypothetical protein n=1 Tax=Enemella evansiae TaxID=2016499 RepID=UPI00117D3E02|nr:hypothetical protein [Enemella evansiae]